MDGSRTMGSEAQLCELRGGDGDNWAGSELERDDRSEADGEVCEGLVERLGEEMEVAEDGKRGQGWGEGYVGNMVVMMLVVVVEAAVLF